MTPTWFEAGRDPIFAIPAHLSRWIFPPMSHQLRARERCWLNVFVPQRFDTLGHVSVRDAQAEIATATQRVLDDAALTDLRTGHGERRANDVIDTLLGFI